MRYKAKIGRTQTGKIIQKIPIPEDKDCLGFVIDGKFVEKGTPER